MPRKSIFIYLENVTHNWCVSILLHLTKAGNEKTKLFEKFQADEKISQTQHIFYGYMINSIRIVRY